MFIFTIYFRKKTINNPMLKAVKVKLYPNPEQQNEMNKLLGSCRFVYNYCLGIKKEAYSENSKNLSNSDLNKLVIQLKNKEEYIWLKEAHSKVIQQSLINLEVAYKNFFKHKSGFPKFKSKHNGDSCRFPVDAIGGVIGNRINLTKKLNNILFKCSVRDEKHLNKYRNNLKSATLSKEKSGKYILSILVDGKPQTKKLKQTQNITGIDIGIKDFIITDKGKRFENLKLIRKNEKKLARLQKNLSRKKLFPKKTIVDGVEMPCLDKSGKLIYERSKNREKSRIKLAKFQEELTNQKTYYIHDVVNQLLNENQVIAMEDLHIKGMMKNHKLARSIQELSIGEFKRILNYKAEWYGRDIITIDRWFASSKKCSCCGKKNHKLKLTDREWTCEGCGAVHDRDINAAINILREGIRILNERMKKTIGLSKPELTLEESGSVDDPTKCKLKSTCSLNQEGNIVRYANVIVQEQ